MSILDKVSYFSLNDGQKIPAIGFGTSGVVASCHSKSPKSDSGNYELLKFAIQCGYRHFDSAYLYGNEEALGKALKDCIDSGLIKREDVYIVTKLWCTAHSRAKAMEAAKESCARLQLDYVDLYLIHWPGGYAEDCPSDVITPKDADGKVRFSNVDYVETWQAMEDIRDAGLAKSIGVSNFNHEQIDRILSMCKHKPVINQVECHPYLSQRKLLDYCKSKNILLTAYCPLGSPGKNDAKPNDPVLLQDPLINELAIKYNKTPAQIVIKFQIQRGVVVIPKSATKDRIRSNIEVFDFDMSSDEISKLENLDRGLRYCQNTAGEFIPNHPHYPFHIEY